MTDGFGRGAVLALGLVMWSSRAQAGGLHDEASVALSGERLATMSYTSVGGDADRDLGTIALFGRASSMSPFDMPRLAFDVFVIPGLSIGGSFSYQKYFLDPRELDVFTFQPRVGYAVSMGDAADFWVKGGLSYYSMTSDVTILGDSPTESGLALSGAFDFAIHPAQHFSIIVGPSIDFGITGEQSVGPNDADVKYTTLALNAGLVGWL